MSWFRHFCALFCFHVSSASIALPVYDLKDPQVAATINGQTISLRVLDTLYKASLTQQQELKRADTLVALTESRLFSQYAKQRFGEAVLIENNKVGFKPETTEQQQYTSLIQAAFINELNQAKQKMGGNLNRFIVEEKPIIATEWPQYLPPKQQLQLEIQLKPEGRVAASKRIVLRYRFDEANQGNISLLDVYEAQNVQGRNEIHNQNNAYVQDQTRMLLIRRYIDYWARTASGLSSDELTLLRNALHERNMFDGYATYIGVAADIHDDNQYLKDLAAKVSQKEINAYYQQHRDEFRTVDKVHARHIVLKDEATANQVAESLAKGGNFVQLAQQYSVATDKNQGGDLGWITAAEKDQEWLKSFAFLQSPHTPSRPIRSPNMMDGKPVWEIVLLDDKVQGYLPMTSSSVRYQASRIIARQKAVNEYQQTRQTLIKNANIHINADLPDLRTDWQQVYMPSTMPKKHGHDH